MIPSLDWRLIMHSEGCTENRLNWAKPNEMSEDLHSDWPVKIGLFDEGPVPPLQRPCMTTHPPSLDRIYSTSTLVSFDMETGTESTDDPPLEAHDLPRRIYLLTMVACLVNFTVGFSMAIIAPALIFIEESLEASVGEVSAIVSFALLGGLVGSVLSGWATDLVGRRKTLTFGTAVMGISSLACALSQTPKQLILARFFQGLGTSLSVVVAGVVMTELSPTSIRGYLGSASQNFLAVGLIASGFTGYLAHYLIASVECWRPMFLVASISGLLSLIFAVAFLEESPRWLVSRHRVDEARAVMIKIYGMHNLEFIDHELAGLSHQHRHLAEVACFDMQDLVSPGQRKPLLLTCALKFIQQFTGTAVIVSYMVIIFTNTGASREEALLFTALSSLPQLVTMILGSYFLDFTGRKKLLLMSQLGVIMTLVFMGFFQYFDGSMQTKAMILGVILFRVFYSLGLGPIPLVLASEILPFKIRGRGLAISTLLHSILGFLLTGAFPWFVRNFGEAPFYWGLAVVSVGGYYFIQRYIDETSNIRLEDLEALNGRERGDITFHVHGQGQTRPTL